MSQQVVIVGGGVGGLTTALALGRSGHRVTLLERDELRPLADAAEAFATERSGAPQVHQTHGFLARLQVTLRDRFPDVLDDLLAAGGLTMPMTAELGEPRPGDEDLKVIIVRRTTLDWVLRRAVEAQDGVELRTAAPVAGLVTSGTAANGAPVVTGVRLDDGTVVEADAVVAATGRRGPIPAWLTAIGVDLDETIVESGLMYMSRWYHRVATDDELDPKLGGDLGFVKYLAVPGDGDTLSVTLAIRTADSQLRAALANPALFDHACRVLPGPNQFFGPGLPVMEPIGPVRPMAGLLNRRRTFVDAEGLPAVQGFHAVGDCHTTTNPLYGRGCALATVQAVLLADAFAEHGDDAAARGAAYEAGSTREVLPWWESSVQMDKLGSDPGGASAPGGGADSDAAKAMASVFVAAQTDPIIGRGIARFMNLLATPAQLMGDSELITRMAEVMADPSAYPVPPREGPTRDELLDELNGLAVTA
jgi:2-polyprenyl-6-methoxyphenol hydroxylase-like FAD-dependent oxidoreductase